MNLKNYKDLETKFARIYKLEQAIELLFWDDQVNMPSSSSESRAQVISEMQLVVQELLLSNNVAELISETDNKDLNAWQQSNLKAMNKQYQDARAIPPDLQQAYTLTVMKSKNAWRELRAKNDWNSFLPIFKEVVNLSRQRGDALASKFGMPIYDALLKTSQEDFDSKSIESFFNDLKTWLPNLAKDIIDKQSTPKLITGNFPTNIQKELGLEIMKVLGFDSTRGRLDISHHPFCGGVPSDVRITTRYYDDDFTKSLMAIIHETGHASYEQGLPREWEFQPVGTNCGMMIHESQSLLFEMQIGRSPEFIKFLIPKIKQFFGEQEEFNLNNMINLYHHVEAGYIRVYADEVTYPLHVILRYEIEKDLMEGKIEAHHIPELWDNKMQQYLGLSTKGNYQNGCMQDMHWPSGLFGYFPSYTLGAMLAAQLFTSIREQIPNIANDIKMGDISKIRDWLSKNLWQIANSTTPNQLIINATGKKLSTEYFKQHLFNRYIGT